MCPALSIVYGGSQRTEGVATPVGRGGVVAERVGAVAEAVAVAVGTGSRGVVGESPNT